MFCGVHTERIAVLKCQSCGIGICGECQVISKGMDLCRKCAATVKISSHDVPMHARHVWTAVILSIIFPGMGQVYNGQVGKGVFILLTCFLVFPYVYGIMDAYRTAVQINKGEVVSNASVVNTAGCMVVMLMLVAGPVVLYKVFKDPIEHYLNDSSSGHARKILENVSRGAEGYFKVKGEYPTSFSDLYLATPPYVDDIYCDVSMAGYAYACVFSKGGYTITAKPEAFTKGLTTLTVTTGGVFSPVE